VRYSIPPEIELKSIIRGEDYVKVCFADGDGCVPILDGENGSEMNFSEFSKFISLCSSKGIYPLLCVEASKKAWLVQTNDPQEETRLSCRLEGRVLILTVSV